MSACLLLTVCCCCDSPTRPSAPSHHQQGPWHHHPSASSWPPATMHTHTRARTHTVSQARHTHEAADTPANAASITQQPSQSKKHRTPSRGDLRLYPKTHTKPDTGQRCQEATACNNDEQLPILFGALWYSEVVARCLPANQGLAAGVAAAAHGTAS